MLITIDTEKDTHEQAKRVIDFWYGRNNNTNQTTLTDKAICEGCGLDVDNKVLNYCKVQFPGHIYCRECQKEVNNQ